MKNWPTFALLMNYLAIAVRTQTRSKLTTFISVSGLAIGMTASLLIGLFVLDEVGYDQSFQNKNSIYRIITSSMNDGQIYTSAQTKRNVAQELLQHFPEVQSATVMMPISEGFLFSGENALKENIIYTDSSFTSVFGLDLLIGNPRACLTRPSSLLISEEVALKLFGLKWAQQSILGKTLSIDGRIPITVTGVFRDFPVHSHFRSNLFASVPEGFEDWLSSGSVVYTYVLLSENMDAANFSKQLKSFSPSAGSRVDRRVELSAQPLTSIYLGKSVQNENAIHGNLEQLYALMLVGLFLMVITVVNFVNLYVANSVNRLKEIGIRKVIGAGSRQLRIQILLEAALTTLFAFCIALVIAALLLPAFNEFTDKEIRLETLLRGRTVLVAVSLIAAVWLSAGLYPSLYLSLKNAIAALKKEKGKTASFIGVRTGLLLVQFIISGTMVVLSIVTYRQVSMINARSLGFDKENTIALSNPYMLGSVEKVMALRNELLTVKGVEHVSITGYTPSQGRWGYDRMTFPEGNEHSSYAYPASWITVDEEFIKTMGLTLSSGRDFSDNHERDKSSIIVNDEAVKHFKLNENGESPIGSILSIQEERDGSLQSFTVVGVVTDFNFGSLHEAIKPLIMKVGYHRFEMALQLSPLYPKQAIIDGVASVWKKNLPIIPFEYTFVKTRFEKLHKADVAARQIASICCVLIVILSVLGLFSMITYTIAGRIKEIGIRKVLGASEKSIVLLLSQKFITLILTAFGLAIPLSWGLAHKWMESFAYKTAISWWIFIVAGLVLVLFSLLPLCYQSLQAALANPVDSLKQD